MNLSQTEKYIIEKTAAGWEAQEIAQFLGKSKRTIYNIRCDLLFELDCKNAAELVSKAYKLGILKI